MIKTFFSAYLWNIDWLCNSIDHWLTTLCTAGQARRLPRRTRSRTVDVDPAHLTTRKMGCATSVRKRSAILPPPSLPWYFHSLLRSTLCCRGSMKWSIPYLQSKSSFCQNNLLAYLFTVWFYYFIALETVSDTCFIASLRPWIRIWKNKNWTKASQLPLVFWL